MSTFFESFTCPNCSGSVIRGYERCPHCLKTKESEKGPVLVIAAMFLGGMLALSMGLPGVLNRSACEKPEACAPAVDREKYEIPATGQNDENSDYRLEVSQQIEGLNREIKENPRDASLYIARGWCYQDVAQYQHAYKDLSRAISLAPSSSEAYCKRAWVLVSLGQFQAAVKDASESLTLDKANDDAHEARATAYMSLGEQDKAEADYQAISR
jgi:tetratricopeptide (TPR) repeat protein